MQRTIGNATMYHGDCRDIIPTLDDVSHVITDPPYEKEAHSPTRRTKDKRMLISPLTFDAITPELRTFIAMECTRLSTGWFLTFCQAEAVAAWRDEIMKTSAKYKNPMVWVKPDATPQFNGHGPAMGYESIVTAYCSAGHSKWNGGGTKGVFIFSKQDVGRGVNRSRHQTQKPIKLMLKLVNLFTNPGDTILDPFMGSGSTGDACARTGRNFIGIEQDKKYFDVACSRLENICKQTDLFIPPPDPKLKQSVMELDKLTVGKETK